VGCTTAPLACTRPGNVLANDTDVDAGDTQDGRRSPTPESQSDDQRAQLATTVTGTLWRDHRSTPTAATRYTVDNNNAAVQAATESAGRRSPTPSLTLCETLAGWRAPPNYVVTICGANDTPVTQIDTANATESGGVFRPNPGFNPSGNVLSNDTDVDAGDTKNVVGVRHGIHSTTAGSVASTVWGTYGSLVINANGSYTYLVDNSNSAVQALRLSNETLTDTFTYTMQDTGGLQSTNQLVITIHSQNDNPVALVDTNIAQEQGGLLNAIQASIQVATCSTTTTTSTLTMLVR
jgi:VCBS repeat-containing protein